MYSQNHEDDLILEYFADSPTGVFLDVGAHDGCSLSNTLALINRGWCGVMVEASPAAFVSLLQSHGTKDRVHLINAAIGFRNDWETFHESSATEVPGMVGSMNNAHVEKWSPAVGYRKFTLHTVGVESLLNRTGRQFDFISVDIEGDSAELFFRLLDAKASAKCWCIEHDERADAIMERMAPLGYRELTRNAENILLAR